MDIVWMIAILIGLIPNASVKGDPPIIASIVVKEGEKAEISCLAKGSHEAYFWWKGDSLHNSTDIASFIGGIDIDDSKHYTATANGTLIIKNVSLKDEGKYICRVASEKSDCYGEIFLYVQASITSFGLEIDVCDDKRSCLIHADPSEFTSLTCRATNASPSMTLKWFNGSREITGENVQNDVIKGSSVNLSSTLDVANGNYGSLTCQAIDSKTGNDDGKFAHVMLELQAPVMETQSSSPAWIAIATIFLIFCLALIAVLLFIKLKSSSERDDHEKQNMEQEVLLMGETEEKDHQIKTMNVEITKLKDEAKGKDYQIRKKDEEITTLKDEAKGKDNQIRKKDEEITTLKQEEAKGKDDQIKTKDKEITKLKVEAKGKDDQIKAKDEEITTLKDKAKGKDDRIKTKDKEITTLKDEAKGKDDRIKAKHEEIATLKDEAKGKDDRIKTKDKEIATLKDEAKGKDDQIKAKDEEITTLKDEAKCKDNQIKTKDKETATLKDSYKQLEKSERVFRAKKMAELESTTGFCGIPPFKDKTRLSMKLDGKDSSIIFHDKESTFSHVFNIGANVRETFQKMSNFVENAIDGGQSCVIAFGTSIQHDQMTTMYGDNAIIPLSYKKILERSLELKHRSYTVNVKARLVHTVEDANGEIFICKGKRDLGDKCVEPTDVEAIDVNDETTMKQLLKDHMESQKKTGIKHDRFVQFIINTTEDGQEVATTGYITFVTLFGTDMIKTCFLMDTCNSKLAQFLSKIVRDPKSKNLLLVHLCGDKDPGKDIIKLTGQITKKRQKQK